MNSANLSENERLIHNAAEELRDRSMIQPAEKPPITSEAPAAQRRRGAGKDEMNTPASSTKSPFASEEEEGAFKAAQRQFVGEGRLDAWKDLLTSGKSLSPRIGAEIARMLSEGQLMLQNQLGEATKRSGVTYALVVKTFKDSRGRPPVPDKQERLEAGAREVWNRVKPGGQLLTTALKQVCKEFRLSPNELRQALRKLEERCREPLLRWPTTSEKTKKAV